MSIIIEGIDLPTEGKVHRIVVFPNGRITLDFKTYIKEYQAIQIPKRARLIDGNDLLLRVVRTPSYKVNINGAAHTVFRDIDVLPEIRHSKAILESEEYCKL